MAKAKELNFIKWEDSKTGILMFGTVRRTMENSVIVDIAGSDDSTVVSHKRYVIISADDPKYAASRFASRVKKWADSNNYIFKSADDSTVFLERSSDSYKFDINARLLDSIMTDEGY